MISAQKTFEVNKQNLTYAIDFLNNWYSENGINKETASKLSVCSDEIISNIIFYSKATFFEINCNKTENQISIEYTDNGISFNPITDSKKPDLNASVENRKIGGLGIFMVEKIVDTVEYNRIDEKNTLKITITQK